MKKMTPVDILVRTDNVYLACRFLSWGLLEILQPPRKFPCFVSLQNHLCLLLTHIHFLSQLT